MNALVLDIPFAQQNPEEFAFLMRYATGAERILEIGSCYGHSLRMLARVAIKGAVLRSIDLGTLPAEAAEFAGADVTPTLTRVIEELNLDGYDAKLHVGDSHSAEAIKFAEKSAPYDLVFIDGDHTFDGVAADLLNYGPMSRHLIACHDIAHPTHGVAKMWREIRTAGGMRTDEKVCSSMGIGLLIKAKAIAFANAVAPYEAHPAHGVRKFWRELNEAGARTDEKVCSGKGIGLLIKA